MQKELCPRCGQYEVVSRKETARTAGALLMLLGVLFLIFVPIMGLIIGPLVMLAGILVATVRASRLKGGVCKKCGVAVKELGPK